MIVESCSAKGHKPEFSLAFKETKLFLAVVLDLTRNAQQI
jgi:hypothetical protein